MATTLKLRTTLFFAVGIVLVLALTMLFANLVEGVSEPAALTVHSDRDLSYSPMEEAAIRYSDDAARWLAAQEPDQQTAGMVADGESRHSDDAERPFATMPEAASPPMEAYEAPGAVSAPADAGRPFATMPEAASPPMEVYEAPGAVSAPADAGRPFATMPEAASPPMEAYEAPGAAPSP